jgi:2-polyprenyl-3-methyl-5-hydroxy-6-metoxy-1,4-benzoquinol methylase
MEGDAVKEQLYFKLRGITSEFYDSYTIPTYMAQVLPRSLSDRILDFGCGLGQTMNALRLRGYDSVSGVDISDESVEHCRKIGLNVERISDVFGHAEKHREDYDLIIMSHVLEHIEKPMIISHLRAIKSMLRSNGALLIMVPNAQSNTDCYWAYEDFTHSTLFTPGSLSYVLRAAGFEQLRFLDPYCVEGLPTYRRLIKLSLLRIFKANKTFWNRVTGSFYHRPSPAIFSYELKALAQ